MNTIKLIDVFGQYADQGTGHYFTYVNQQQNAPVGWRTVMKDPRNEVSHDLESCYSTWCTSTDWWIAKLVKNPHDPRSGLAMLSICLGSNRPADGEKAAMVLDQFAQFFLIDKNWDQADAEKALINYGQDLELVPCKPMQFVAPSIEINSAYRSYETKQELGKMLSYLPQSGYANYSRIFFVPKEMASGMPAKCIDELIPLRNIYSVQCPANCSVSKTEVMDGEELIITYTKPGLEPVEKVISVGKASDIVSIDGTFMNIKSEEELGLAHSKVIEVKCRDKKTGAEVPSFKLDNYTQQYPIDIRGNKVYFSEYFSKTVVLRVRSYGSYDEQTFELNPQSISGNVVWVELESKEFKVVFRLGSTDYETTNTLNPSSARMKWSNYSYDVDEKAHKIILRVNPEPMEKHYGNDTYYDHDDRDLPFVKRVGKFFKKNWTFIAAGLLVLLVAYGIYALVSFFAIQQTPWPFGNREQVTTITDGQTPDNSSQDENASNNDGENTEEDECEGQSVDSLRNADVEYLKNFDEWDKKALKSEFFVPLIDAFIVGDVDAVVQFDTLFDGCPKNGLYDKIVKELQKVSSVPQKKQYAKNEMLRICGDNVVHLSKLLGSFNQISAETSKTEVNKVPVSGNSNASTQKSANNKKENEGGRATSDD